MADLNDLLDQATAQATGLSQQVETALSAVDEVLQHARGIVERVGADGAAARAGLANLADRLAQLEDDVEQQANEARGRLDALQAEAGEARGELQGIFSRMQDLLESGRAEQQRLVESFDADSDAVVTATQQAVAAMRELEAEAGGQISSLESAVDDFQAQLERLRDDVTARLAAAVQQANEFVAEVEGLAERTAEVTEDVVGRAREEVETLSEQVPAQVAEAARAIGEKYGEEAVRHVQELLPRFESTLDEFAQEAEAMVHELDERRSRAADHANGIRAFLDNVEEVAQAAQVLA